MGGLQAVMPTSTLVVCRNVFAESVVDEDQVFYLFWQSYAQAIQATFVMKLFNSKHSMQMNTRQKQISKSDLALWLNFVKVPT